jgi:PAS domain S-box-containing protein
MTLLDSAPPAGGTASRLEDVDPPVPMVILERGLVIRWMSRTAITEFGLKAEYIIGRSWYDLFPQSLARRDEHEALFRGEVDRLDIPRIELKLGCETPRYFSLHVRPLRAADGTVEAILGVGEEVTALVKTEQALRASEVRLETALWGSKAAFWTILVRDDRAEMSPNFFNFTGIDPAQWAAERHPWNSRMHPEDRPRARRTYEDYVTGRIDFYECEYRLKTPGGWMWLHDRGRVTERDAEGRPVVIAGTTQDAGERKNLEQALAQAAVIEQRRISYDLHDGLGQELTGIQFLLGTVARRLRAERPVEAIELEEVVAHVCKAIDTTRTIAQGLVPPSLRYGDLRLAIEDLAADVSRRFGMQVECTAERWRPKVISEFTAQHLYRITQEALHNAHRHGHALGAIVELNAGAEALALSIIDDGCGIPDTLPETRGIGIMIMTHRARSIGATLTIGRDSRGGTRVTVQRPFDPDAPGP